MYSDVLKAKKREYKESYKKVSNTANALKGAIGSLKIAIQYQNSSYRINDVSGGSNHLDHVLEKEQEIYSNIVDNILPGIDSKIRGLEEDIERALEEESEDDE